MLYEVITHIIAHTVGAVCAIAHRQELVSQISIALARNHIRHRIIGPLSLTRNIIRLHMEEFNASYIDPNAKCAVAGVDTLIVITSYSIHYTKLYDRTSASQACTNCA